MLEGGEVSVYYDPMIAKLIAWAPGRDEAIARMARALTEYEIDGVATNIPACNFVLAHSSFQSGTYDTGFFERWYKPDPEPRPDEDVATAMAVLAAWLEGSRTGKTAPGVAGPIPEAVRRADDGGAGWKAGRIRAMRGGTP